MPTKIWIFILFVKSGKKFEKDILTVYDRDEERTQYLVCDFGRKIMDTTSILLAVGFLAFACLAYFLSRNPKKGPTKPRTTGGATEEEGEV